MKAFQLVLTVVLLPQVIFGNLLDDLERNGLTTLKALIEKAGIAGALAEPLTIFAPTNDAFSRVPQATLDQLNADNDLLTSVLTYHVVAGNIPSSALQADNKVTTLNGAPLRVNVYQKYHTTVTANGVKVVKPDVPAGESSVVHVVNEVLPVIGAEDSIAAVLTNDPEGRFSTLLAAVSAAGLVDAVSNPDATLTVFAPTNAAFEKIPSAALNNLLQPENRQALTDVLLRHVLPEAVFAKGICWNSFKTLNPSAKLSTQLYKGGLVVAKTSAGYARVVDADIVATNGVVHAIDTVI